MAHEIQTANGWARQLRQTGTVLNPSSEPVFFFDGDFRTLAQVELRAQLNRAIAAHIAKHPQRLDIRQR